MININKLLKSKIKKKYKIKMIKMKKLKFKKPNSLFLKII